MRSPISRSALNLLRKSKALSILLSLSVLTLLTIGTFPDILFGQITRINDQSKKAIYNEKKLPMLLRHGGNDPLNIDSRPYEEIWLEYSVDWTNCSIHRADNYDPFQLLLCGNLASNSSIIWSLSPSLPQANQPPILYFVENVLGNTACAYATNIPLTWEIALDGGSFSPMTLLPNNTLTTTFPPGPHTFQVRITGTPQYHQADGYYHLQLTQCLVPQL